MWVLRLLLRTAALNDHRNTILTLMVCLDVQGSRPEKAARAAGVRARDAEDQPAPVGLLQPVL